MNEILSENIAVNVNVRCTRKGNVFTPVCLSIGECHPMMHWNMQEGGTPPSNERGSQKGGPSTPCPPEGQKEHSWAVIDTPSTRWLFKLILF